MRPAFVRSRSRQKDGASGRSGTLVSLPRLLASHGRGPASGFTPRETHRARCNESGRASEPGRIGNAVKIQIIARNNYTLRSEQRIITGTWSGDRRPIDCELVHEIFDLAEAEGVERRGYSGTGAGARVVIVNEAGDEMEVKSPGEAIEVLGNLPQGSRMRAFKFRARRARRAVWNGHNFVAVDAPNIENWIEHTA